MPLVYQEHIGKAGNINIWQVTEEEAALLAAVPALLMQDAALEKYTHPYRRKQWLASRVLLHTLLPGACLTYNESGKPHLSGATGHISFSHSGDFIALVHDQQPTGIDIERIRPGIARIASKFINDTEWQASQAGPQPERLHAYWCIKEAVYKVYGRKGISLKTNIFVTDFVFADPGYAFAELHNNGLQLRCRLKFRIIQDFLLACVEN